MRGPPLSPCSIARAPCDALTYTRTHTHTRSEFAKICPPRETVTYRFLRQCVCMSRAADAGRDINEHGGGHTANELPPRDARGEVINARPCLPPLPPSLNLLLRCRAAALSCHCAETPLPSLSAYSMLKPFFHTFHTFFFHTFSNKKNLEKLFFLFFKLSNLVVWGIWDIFFW